MARDYVAVPYEYETEMDMLTDAEFGQLIKALIRYSRDGELINLPNNAQFYAKRVMKREDYYKKGYDEIADKKSRAGKAGAEKRWNNSNEKQGVADDSKNSSAISAIADDSKNSKNNNNNKNDNKKDVPNGTITPLSPLGERSPELRQAVEDWLTYKKQKNQGYKEMGIKSLVTQILNNCQKYGDSVVADVINRSMAANYQGITWDWLKQSPQGNTPPITTSRQSTSSADRLLDMINGGVFDEPEGERKASDVVYVELP